MVADKVTRRSPARRPTAADGVRWESDGQGDVHRRDRREADARHRRRSCTCAKDEDEFLDAVAAARRIVKKYSDFIELPDRDASQEERDEDGEKRSRAEETGQPGGRRSGCGRRARSRRGVRGVLQARSPHDFERAAAPARTTASRARRSSRCCCFIPAQGAVRPVDPRQAAAGVKLYVQRVLIMDDCEAAAAAATCGSSRGVVDSADLPLNVSRELLQESRVRGRSASARPSACCRC